MYREKTTPLTRDEITSEYLRQITLHSYSSVTINNITIKHGEHYLFTLHGRKAPNKDCFGEKIGVNHKEAHLNTCDGSMVEIEYTHPIEQFQINLTVTHINTYPLVKLWKHNTYFKWDGVDECWYLLAFPNKIPHSFPILSITHDKKIKND